MKAVIREHIAQLDVSTGGGIISEKIRVDTIDNPMLIIGLGGTGIDALLRLKYQINRRFQLPEDPITKKKRDKPDHIEFIAFETNENDRHKKYPLNGIGMDPATEFVPLSNAEIGGLLHNRSILEPYITEWLSPELTITDGINGASGVRQAGRLLMFAKINQVVQTIERKINKLTVGTNKKLLVFILAGLSGGTGSGMFLDIPYIVRGLLERDHGASGVDKVSILGYLFMPDVNLSNQSMPDHTGEYIKKNGYAALKELDYWMNVDERGERFNQRYGDILTVQSPMPPFNLAHLVSATNLEGKLLENAYDYCMNVTAENIVNFMASEEKQSGEEFAIHDYISNIDTNIRQMVKPYAANYKYTILGASSAVLPIEEMTTYLAFCLFNKMEKMFDAIPTPKDVERLAYKLGLNPDAVQREFLRHAPEPLPGYQNSERLSYNNVVKQPVVDIDTELEQGFLSRALEEYKKSKRKLSSDWLERFSVQLNRIFTNPEQGPLYASKIIQSDKGFCLLKQIQNDVETLKENLFRISQDIEHAKENADRKFGDARSALISKEKKKNIYIDAKIRQYLLISDQKRMEQMIDFYEDLFNKMNEQHSRVYKVFAELLNALNDVFKRNGNLLIHREEQTDHKGNRTYFWNIVNIPEMENVIHRFMDEKNPDDLIRDFANELLERSNQWIKEQEVDIVNSISSFLTEQFGDFITQSMEEFLKVKFGQEESIDKVVEQIIAHRLNKEAIPVYHLNNSFGNLNFPSWGFVSVPVDSPGILKGIKNFRTHAASSSRFTIKESEVKNRIFWLNTINGIPLFLYTPLKVFEESYERTILDSEGVGRHLAQTEKNNWTCLPSPIPEKSWGDVYVNHRLKSYNEEIRRLFDKAVQLGCIRTRGNDTNTTYRYECIFTQPFELDEFLAGYLLQLDQPKPNLGELKRCMDQLRFLLKNGLKRTSARAIFGSMSDEMAKENFIRSPELIKGIREEVKKYTQIADQIAQFETWLNAFQDEEKLVELFIEVMYTGTIVKRGAQYVYDHDPGEESWEPIVNLLKVNQYVEYHIFEQIRNLGSVKRTTLERKSSERSARLASADHVGQLVRALRELEMSIRETKAKLDYDRSDRLNGEEIYAFYMQAAGKVNDILKSLVS